MFSIIQLLFLQKNPKPSYPHPKYLFGIGIWNWAAKSWIFSLYQEASDLAYVCP